MISLQRTNEKRGFVEKFYCIIVAVLPVLAMYASGIPGFSLADFVLILCVALTFFQNTKRKNTFVKEPNEIYIALFFIVFFGVISSLTQDSPQYFNMVTRTIRYVFYLFVVFYCSTRIFDIEYCSKIVKVVAVMATAYILLQYFMYSIFGISLQGKLSFLQLYLQNDSRDNVYGSMYRPASFFLEPAHYARYCLIAVVICLFSKSKYSINDLVVAVFLSMGILVSTSAQGYALLAVVWCIFFVKLLLKKKNVNEKKVLSCLILLLPILFGIAISLPFVRDTLVRAFQFDIKNSATALGGRLSGYFEYFSLPWIYKVIGMGFGVVPEDAWLSSAVYFLYGAGGIVFALYFVYCCACYKRTRGAARYILLLFMILLFTDDSFYSYMCVLFLSLSILKSMQKRDSEGK